MTEDLQDGRVVLYYTKAKLEVKWDQLERFKEKRVLYCSCYQPLTTTVERKSECEIRFHQFWRKFVRVLSQEN